jgi:hypothetical protein
MKKKNDNPGIQVALWMLLIAWLVVAILKLAL